MDQTPDEAFSSTLDGESNSVTIIVKHVAGNMRSRWTDFLTTDGEKSDRNRDAEFETPPKTRAEVVSMWEPGWGHVFKALTPLTEDDLARTVWILREPHSVMQAINRQIAHYSYHVGQIIYLATHFAGDHWTALTVHRSKSAEFNARVAAQESSQR